MAVGKPDFSMKAHDRLPVIQAKLTQGEAGTIVDLTLANSVSFIMRAADADWKPIAGTPKVNAAAQVVGSAVNGDVQYAWAVGDSDTPGLYVGEWEVIWASGLKPQTFPTRSYHTIEITADLDAA